jgi:hypothetical protein
MDPQHWIAYLEDVEDDRMDMTGALPGPLELKVCTEVNPPPLSSSSKPPKPPPPNPPKPMPKPGIPKPKPPPNAPKGDNADMGNP